MNNFKKPQGWCGVLMALLPLVAQAVDDLTVQNTTYTTTQTVSATNTITATPAVVVSSGANITFVAGTRITLGTGFSVASGGLFRVATGQLLPYTAGFESSEGYATGSISAQQSWQLIQGAAEVSTASYSAGARGLALLSSGTAAVVKQYFVPYSSPTVVFLDLYAKPVAATAASNSSTIETEAAKIGFQINAGQAEVYNFDGVGANQWVGSGVRFALNGSNQATSWQRLTLRLDYTAKKWDVYLGGTLIDYDLAFSNTSESYFRLLTLSGVTSATAYVDAVGASGTNPLFTDADKDGMSDAWETSNGLNTAADDRNGDSDGDGRTNIEEYYLGTAANNADVTAPTVPGSFVNSAATSTSVGLSWTASTDSGAGTTGVAGYNIYRDGVKLNSTPLTSTSYTDTGLSVQGTYTYTVRAVDLAGNLSAPATSLTLITLSNSFELFTPRP